MSGAAWSQGWKERWLRVRTGPGGQLGSLAPGGLPLPIGSFRNPVGLPLQKLSQKT